MIHAGLLRIEGTATDAGGGCVAAVEVSFDDGLTWHPASGRETWIAHWTPPMPGRYAIRCRAVDDSGNLERPGEVIALSVS